MPLESITQGSCKLTCSNMWAHHPGSVKETHRHLVNTAFLLPCCQFPLARQLLTVALWLLSLCHVASAAVVLGLRKDSCTVSRSALRNLQIPLLDWLSVMACVFFLLFTVQVQEIVSLSGWVRWMCMQTLIWPCRVSASRSTSHNKDVVWCRAGCKQRKNLFSTNSHYSSLIEWECIWQGLFHWAGMICCVILET